MQAIAKSHQQFALLCLGSPRESYTYLKRFGKAHRKMKGVLPNVEADRVLNIFAFTPCDIQALYLPVKDIVDEIRYLTGSVEAQETDLFHHLLKMSFNIFSFYTQHVITTQDGMTNAAQFTELAKVLRLKNHNFNGDSLHAFSNSLGDCHLYKMLVEQQSAYKGAYKERYDLYRVIHGDLSKDEMREMWGSTLLENFDSYIGNICFCELGKDPKIFLGRTPHSCSGPCYRHGLCNWIWSMQQQKNMTRLWRSRSSVSMKLKSVLVSLFQTMYE